MIVPLAVGPWVFLPAVSGWHLQADDVLFTYRLRLSLPRGQHGIVPGRRTPGDERADGTSSQFEFAQPMPGIDLMAGPYRIEERRVRSIDGRDIALQIGRAHV